MSHQCLPAEALYEKALQTLREHGNRITAPRRAILSILTTEHGPFTVEELHARLKGGECDLVTVYRILSAFEELAVVRRCDFGDGSYRYEINTGEHHHHHLVCRECQSAEIIDVCVADSLERLARQKGYTNVSHLLEIFGICPACQAKKKR